MSDFDLVIRNATVVTAADTSVCDLAVRDGRIVTLGERLAAGRKEIDDRQILETLAVARRGGHWAVPALRPPATGASAGREPGILTLNTLGMSAMKVVPRRVLSRHRPQAQSRQT